MLHSPPKTCLGVPLSSPLLAVPARLKDPKGEHRKMGGSRKSKKAPMKVRGPAICLVMRGACVGGNFQKKFA